MPRRASGRSVKAEDIKWHNWNDQIRGEFDGVRWGSVFNFDERPSIGLFEIAPGAELPKHHHDAAEVYFVVQGEGYVKVYNVDHALEANTTVFIPADATHVTVNTGNSPLRILYTFPFDRFDDVTYHILG